MLRKSTELKSPPIGGLKAIAAFWIACGILMASITHHILTDRPDDKPHSAAKKKSVAHRQPVAVRPEVVPVPAPAPEPAPAARPVVAIIDLPKEPAAIAPHAPPRELQLPLIEMPGTRTMEDKDGFSIVFDYGAFSRVDQLRAEARNTLAELAERIRPQMDRVSVVVTGFTDNDPVPANRPYKSNVELGMMRAVAASKVLIEAGLPSDKVATRSLGDHETPYPNDTADNKARNRTVVVSIRRQP
jgi:outer membrane protein OmpA-like peptidoglycan-associated protein